MFSYKYLIISISLFLFFILPGCASRSNVFEFPQCEGQFCNITAITKPLPPHAENGRYTIDLDQFSILLPSPPLRIYRLLDGDIYVYFEKGDSLSFSLDSKKSLSEDDPWPDSSNYSIADSAEFIFTKTGKNLVGLTNKDDIWIMKRALFLKGELFNPHSEIQFSRKNDFSLYYWKDTAMKNVCFAYIFSKNIRDRYIRISSSNMQFDDFKSIVASVTATDHFRIRRGDK